MILPWFATLVCLVWAPTAWSADGDTASPPTIMVTPTPTPGSAASGATAQAVSSPAGGNSGGPIGGSVGFPIPPAPFTVRSLSEFSPQIIYSPDGAWTTSMLVSVANTSSSSVSLLGAASGIMMKIGADDAVVLVNGTSPEQWNGWTPGNSSTNVTASTNSTASASASGSGTNATGVSVAITPGNVTVTGLPFAWWNFTVVFGSKINTTSPPTPSSGEGPGISSNKYLFYSATLNDTGSEFLPALGGPILESSNTTSMITTTGNWTTERSYTTREEGASLTIRPPNGTALLILYGGAPPVPFTPFDVSISPAPPFGPSSVELRSALRQAEIVAAIAMLNVPVYEVVLDPRVAYSLNVTNRGQNMSQYAPFSLSGFGFYKASRNNESLPGSQNAGNAAPAAARNGALVLAPTGGLVIAALSVVAAMSLL